jgi:hypothetical protein
MKALRFAGVETFWLVSSVVVGATAWVVVASWRDNASDHYWMANGHPPPVGMFTAPTHLRFWFPVAPYLLSVAIRLTLSAARRLRPSAA